MGHPVYISVPVSLFRALGLHCFVKFLPTSALLRSRIPFPKCPCLIEISYLLKKFLLPRAITTREHIPTFDHLSQCAPLSHPSLLPCCSGGHTLSCFCKTDTRILKSSSYSNGQVPHVCHPQRARPLHSKRRAWERWPTQTGSSYPNNNSHTV